MPEFDHDDTWERKTVNEPDRNVEWPRVDVLPWPVPTPDRRGSVPAEEPAKCSGPRLVYIAGPMTLGDSFRHIGDACYCWLRLWRAGVYAIAPQWSAIQGMVAPISWQEWMEYDSAIIPHCIAMLRLPGESKGADRETDLARRLNIPVFEDEGELIAYVRNS